MLWGARANLNEHHVTGVILPLLFTFRRCILYIYKRREYNRVVAFGIAGGQLLWTRALTTFTVMPESG